MAQSKLKYKGEIVGMDRIVYASSPAVLFTSLGFTIPANTGGVVVHCDGAIHWHPTGTPTTTYGHAVLANELFYIPANQISTAKIIPDSGSALEVIAAFMRGAGRQDAAYTAQARPN